MKKKLNSFSKDLYKKEKDDINNKLKKIHTNKEPSINLKKMKANEIKKIVESVDIDKLTPDNIEYVSKVKKKFETITSDIFKGNLTEISSNSYIALLKYILAMLIDMLPKAEESYYEQGKSPYNVLNISRLIKELAETLKEFEESNNYTNIENNIIKPKLEDFTRFLLIELDNSRNKLNDNLSLKRKELKIINEIYTESLSNIKMYMLDLYKSFRESFNDYYNVSKDKKIKKRSKK